MARSAPIGAFTRAILLVLATPQGCKFLSTVPVHMCSGDHLPTEPQTLGLGDSAALAGSLQTLADDTDEEDPQAIQLDGEDGESDGEEGGEVVARQLRRQPGRKPQPSSVKLEAKKAARKELAARLALKQQRRDVENLSGRLQFCAWSPRHEHLISAME